MARLPFRVRRETEWEQYRARTFFTKEPETVAWIRAFKPGDRFLDIGANIGLYSLYAASRGHKSLAVEPHTGNFHALALNVRTLNPGIPVEILFGAAGDKPFRPADFLCDTDTPGTSGGQLRLERAKTKGFKVRTIYVYSVDMLMEMTLKGGPFQHIKIDIDGQEKRVVAGMRKSLRRKAFKSCLIEVSKKTKTEIVHIFEKAGYTQDVCFNAMEPHSRERREQENIDAENIIFAKPGTFPNVRSDDDE